MLFDIAWPRFGVDQTITIVLSAGVLDEYFFNNATYGIFVQNEASKIKIHFVAITQLCFTRFHIRSTRRTKNKDRYRQQ